ncbi:MAG: hypothetical protein PVG22_13810 [Chromatiales bacterium]|jgi:hypothetical protein
MNRTAFYAFLIVLVLSIVYVFKTTENPPDTGMTQTPEQYIEQLERSKADKKAGEPVDGSFEAATATEGSIQTQADAQR